ncbi:hypothetical protein FOZ63_023449 [Perkinsus olseni]|uniref:Sphingomyelin synthase-like domain-containing protein n=1 Tax=Perkinsus olseni TaxID=32597 RepID=A0A7J6PAB3_PEROL|nr:hypothetical protein FOZ63_023449 [Perkinsus olseni]
MKQLACWQLVAGCLWMAACAYVNCISQVYSDKFHNEYYHGRTPELLPDLGFYLFPRIEILHLADYWNVSMAVGTMVPVVLFHPERRKVILRFLAIQGSVFLLRSATIIVTLLPQPYPLCVNGSSPDENVFIEAVKIVLGIRITCGDLLFSGHTANLTLMALIWSEYGYGFLAVDATTRGYSALGGSNRGQVGRRHRGGPVLHFVFRRLLPLLWWAAAISGYFVIVATRFHYTVDVLVAIIIVTKQWGLYHMYIRTPRIMRRLGFLRWYEQKQDLASASAKKTPRMSPVGARTLSIEMEPIPEHPDLEALEAGKLGSSESSTKESTTAGPQLYGRSRSSREALVC